MRVFWCYSTYAGVLLANVDWATWILHTECVNSGWTPGCTVSGTLWQPRPNDPARDCTVHREVLYSGNAIPPPILLPTPALPPLFPLELPLYLPSPLHSTLPLVSTFSISPSMLLFNTNFPAFFSLSKYFYDTVVSRTEMESSRYTDTGPSQFANCNRLVLWNSRTSWSGLFNQLLCR